MRRFAEADMVRENDAVVRRQESRYPREVVLVGTKAVQQHDRFALPAFQVHVVQAAREVDFLARETGAVTLSINGQACGLLGREVDETRCADGRCNQRNNQYFQQAHSYFLNYPSSNDRRWLPAGCIGCLPAFDMAS